MKKISLFICFVLLISCNKQVNHPIDKLPELYTKPLSARINLHKGYTLNVITGDSIGPSINDNHEVVQTGKQLLLQGDTLPLDKTKSIPIKTQFITKTFKKNRIVKAGKPIILQASTDSFPTPKQEPYVLINPVGDTLPTGKPIRIKGERKLMGKPARIKVSLAKTMAKSQYDIQFLGVDNGMLTNTVYDMCHSKRGGVWLATYRGLSYYNGASFEHYTREQGLPDNNVRSVLEDKNGNVWMIFLGSGVGKFDGDSLILYRDNLPTKYNYRLLEDKKGNIWWGSNKGLCKYDGEFFTQYTRNEGLVSNSSVKIVQDKEGNIWIPNRKTGLSKFDGKTFTLYDQRQGLPDMKVDALFADTEGNIWINYNTVGLVKYDGKQFLKYSPKQGFRGKYIWCFYQDKKGDLWMGTQNGVIHFDGTYFTHFSNKEGLAGSSVMRIVADDQDNLWLSTLENGLVRFNRESFEFFHLKDLSVISALDQDTEGNVWMVVDSKGWIRFDGENYHLTKCAELSHQSVVTFKRDSKGNLWIGTMDGLLKFREGKLCKYLSGWCLSNIVEDKQGNLWVGACGGSLFKFTSSAIIRYEQGWLANDIVQLLKDQKDNIWVVGQKGISKISDQKVVFYSQKEGLSGSIILSIFEDSQGTFWFGTYNSGLIHFDGEKFTYLTTKEGLSSNDIQSVLEGPNGDIWVATARSLDRIRKQGQQMSIVPYDFQHNGNLVEFRLKSALATPKGMLYWGSDKHLVSLDARNFRPKQLSTSVVISKIEIKGQDYEYRALGDSLKGLIKFERISKFYQVPEGLSIPYTLNSVTFHFGEIKKLTNNTKTWFSYRIKELNQPWSKLSQARQAVYQNLPSGTFTLQVKALSKTQQWSDTLEYTFTIRAPYWETWWFRLLSICFFAAILVGLHQWRLSTIRRKKQQLERTLAIKTIDLLKANQQLLTLNDELSQSKNDVIALKEKERVVLTKTLKSRERRFFTALKIFDEKYKALREIDTRLSKTAQTVRNPHLLQIKDDFQDLLRSIANLDILAESVESKYPQILAEINTLFPDLSQNEAKHCLLIRLNCSAKESAQLLGVSANAAHMARKRLKKKLGLNDEESLREYLQRTFI